MSIALIAKESIDTQDQSKLLKSREPKTISVDDNESYLKRSIFVIDTPILSYDAAIGQYAKQCEETGFKEWLMRIRRHTINDTRNVSKLDKFRSDVVKDLTESLTYMLTAEGIQANKYQTGLEMLVQIIEYSIFTRADRLDFYFKRIGKLKCLLAGHASHPVFNFLINICISRIVDTRKQELESVILKEFLTKIEERIEAAIQELMSSDVEDIYTIRDMALLYIRDMSIYYGLTYAVMYYSGRTHASDTGSIGLAEVLLQAESMKVKRDVCQVGTFYGGGTSRFPKIVLVDKVVSIGKGIIDSINANKPLSISIDNLSDISTIFKGNKYRNVVGFSSDGPSCCYNDRVCKECNKKYDDSFIRRHANGKPEWYCSIDDARMNKEDEDVGEYAEEYIEEDETA